MPSNPSIIPGVYGFGDDLAQAFANIGRGLALPIMAEKLKIEKALEAFRDPVFMEKAATDLVMAQRRDELSPQATADAGAETEFGKTLDSYLLSVNLDPTNPKHRAAAEGLLGTAYKSLPAPQRAQARLDAEKDYQKEYEKIQRQATENIAEGTRLEGQALRLTGLEQTFAEENWDAEKSYRENVLAIRGMVTDAQKLLLEEFVPLWEQNPVLANLMAVGGPEAFVEGILRGALAGPENALTPQNEMDLAKLEAQREAAFGLALQNMVGLEGNELKLALSNALNEYRAWDRLGRFGMKDSMFPVSPALYEGGIFKTVPKMRLLFGLAPTGVNVSPYFWAGWRDAIISKFQREGGEAVVAELMTDNTWQSMNEQQRRDVLGTLASIGIYLPLDLEPTPVQPTKQELIGITQEQIDAASGADKEDPRY